jgi:hypothetical protein
MQHSTAAIQPTTRTSHEPVGLVRLSTRRVLSVVSAEDPDQRDFGNGQDHSRCLLEARYRFTAGSTNANTSNTTSGRISTTASNISETSATRRRPSFSATRSRRFFLFWSRRPSGWCPPNRWLAALPWLPSAFARRPRSWSTAELVSSSTTKTRCCAPWNTSARSTAQTVVGMSSDASPGPAPLAPTPAAISGPPEYERPEGQPEHCGPPQAVAGGVQTPPATGSSYLEAAAVADAAREEQDHEHDDQDPCPQRHAAHLPFYRTRAAYPRAACG